MLGNCEKGCGNSEWKTGSVRLTTKLLQLFLKNGIGNKPGAV
jgi:hypothetical protein